MSFVGTAVETILLLFTVFFASVLFHEIGHALFMASLGKKIEIDAKIKGLGIDFFCGKDKDYATLSARQRFGVYSFGVILGLAFLIVVCFFWIAAVATIPFYLAGCHHDILLAVQCWKKAKEDV